jgi:crotonobetainyl-CoA:carnitine CoA-transferase CaiB-like acyl-CoA transferase
MVEMEGCLEGVRVLDLSRYQAGPRAGTMLSDLGAEVIKVEKMGGETNRQHSPIVQGQSLYFSAYNRGKKSVCLDLRQEAGKSVFWDLLKTADIVIQNFRPATLAKMGMDYESLCKVKSDIILLSGSAFGQRGRHRDRPGFDTVGQAISGLMTLTGKPVGRPLGTASSIIDRSTALYLTIGALAALRHRDLTGEGQEIDVSLFDTAMTMVEVPVSYYLMTGEEGGGEEGGRPAIAAKDGWVIISAGTPDMRKRLAEVTGVVMEPLADGSYPPMGVASSDGMAAWCADRTVEDIVATLSSADIVAAPVLSIPEVAQDPLVLEREALVKLEDPIAGEIYVPGLPIKFSKMDSRLGPVPMPGQHTEEILAALPGYDAEKISELRATGAI